MSVFSVRLDTIIEQIRLGKCTHQCDETQENNSIQALSTKTVFFGRKKINTRTCRSRNIVDLSSCTRRRNFLSKAVVYCCFLFRRIGEHICLDLFHFVSLTNSCPLTPLIPCFRQHTLLKSLHRESKLAD